MNKKDLTKAKNLDAALDLIIIKSALNNPNAETFSTVDVSISLPTFLVETVAEFCPDNDPAGSNKILSLFVSKLSAAGYYHEIKRLTENPKQTIKILKGEDLDPKTT